LQTAGPAAQRASQTEPPQFTGQKKEKEPDAISQD
jgi:hypothetical protein